ncbi:MAG: alpha-tubulin suppressor-like RCC1 family protein, partial [Myxococcota bacterium]
VRLAAFDGAESPIVQLNAGRTHFCARSELGAVWCWGRNAEGQLGEHPTRVPTPIRLEMPEAATDIALGSYHTCALGQSGALWCLGRTLNGVLGSQPEPFVKSATRFEGFPADDPPVDIESGIVHSCAVLRSGQVRSGHRENSVVVEAPARQLPVDIFYAGRSPAGIDGPQGAVEPVRYIDG